MTASEDFTSVTGAFRSELLVHCYRMLGSADEAEDLVQETYLRAWKGYARFQGRSSRGRAGRAAPRRRRPGDAPRAGLVHRPRHGLTFVAEKILTTRGRFRMRPARANGQPAFATYERGGDGAYRAHAVQVLTLAPGGIARLDIFLDPGLFRVFGLPRQLGEAVAAGAAIPGPGAGLSG